MTAPELCFCPACGEPRATRVFSDVYTCGGCDLAGEITGWDGQSSVAYRAFARRVRDIQSSPPGRL